MLLVIRKVCTQWMGSTDDRRISFVQSLVSQRPRQSKNRIPKGLGLLKTGLSRKLNSESARNRQYLRLFPIGRAVTFLSGMPTWWIEGVVPPTIRRSDCKRYRAALTGRLAICDYQSCSPPDLPSLFGILKNNGFRSAWVDDLSYKMAQVWRHHLIISKVILLMTCPL